MFAFSGVWTIKHLLAQVASFFSEKAAPTSKRGKKAAKKVEEDPETEESTDPAKNELAVGDKVRRYTYFNF